MRRLSYPAAALLVAGLVVGCSSSSSSANKPTVTTPKAFKEIEPNKGGAAPLAKPDPPPP
jgi:hypothetical protein